MGHVPILPPYCARPPNAFPCAAAPMLFPFGSCGSVLEPVCAQFVRHVYEDICDLPKLIALEMLTPVLSPIARTHTREHPDIQHLSLAREHSASV